MEDKFKMTVEENIFVAKKLLVENIYHSARLEGCNVTFPQTQTILDGVNVGSVRLGDIQTILNLRDAWRFILDTIGSPLDLDYICKINGHVSRNESLSWGVLRTGDVRISGTNYVPDVPLRNVVVKEMEGILSAPTATSRAIKLFLWGCRSQLFWDGNKRTATLMANKLLIAEGKGILSIREGNLLEFNERLTRFYDTNDYSNIDRFLYDNCIGGMVVKRDQEVKR
ncbi:MAG: Fic family protein [Peptococcaceae bacterium]|nr:Fic family protein [Peptococcaceae bacterium]